MSDIPFKISARTAHLIGRGNISTPEGAIVELVKNAYDADAEVCIVYLQTDRKGKKTLFIMDNGHGMDGKVIEDSWMVIGSSEKVANPKSSGKKRIKTGAKGIGRFALDRLGGHTQMITVSENNFEGHLWDVKWEDFLMSKTLDTVYATLLKRPIDFSGTIKDITSSFPPAIKSLKPFKFSNGTIHKITNLRDEWSIDTSDKLFKDLEILIPPKGGSPFKIFFFDSREQKKYGEVKGFFFDDYDYKIHVVVDENQTVKITMDRQELDVERIDPDVFKERPPNVPQNMSQFPYDKKTLKKGVFENNTTLQELWPGIYDTYDKATIKGIGPFDCSFYYMRASFKEDDAKVYPYRNIDAKKRNE